MLSDVNLIIAILTGISVLITNIWLFLRYTWNVAQEIGKRDRRIEKLETDINNLRAICKGMINTESWKSQVQITHIQQYLEKTSDYHAPTMSKLD